MRVLIAALACRAGGSRLYGKPLHNLDIERRRGRDQFAVQPRDRGHEVRAGSREAHLRDVDRLRRVRVLSGGLAQELRLDRDRLEPGGVRSAHRLVEPPRHVDGHLQIADLAITAGGGTDVFRITTESPFIYFEPIPEAWRRHVGHGNDVTSVAGVPDGPGFEMITLDTLRRSHRLGDSRHRSELVTLYVKEHQDDFRVEALEAPGEVNRMDIRLTIDYPEDLVVCRRIYERFKALAPRIPLAYIVEYWDATPELADLVKPYVAWERWYR